MIVMLSQTVEYAIRATLYVASDPSRSVRVMEIARAVDAPPTYLAKILGQLARAGVLASARGPAGGFRLAQRADQVPLSDIVAVFEATEQRRCLLGNGVCGQKPGCTMHARWAPIARDLNELFVNTTVADLLTSPRTTI